MKSYISAALIFAVLLVTVPAAPLLTSELKHVQAQEILEGSSRTENEDPEELSSGKGNEEDNEKEEKENAEEEKYKVLDITTGKVEEITAFDYIVGAVCAEMPATFEPEALKAQAVAAHTYAQRQKEKAAVSPDKDLNGAYFSNDSSKYQAYFTDNQAKQYYGDDYEEYIKKIRDAVSDVEDEILVYEGEPIIAAFHSMSAGTTESAENVWGSKVDYLIPVESDEDTSAPRYLEEYEYTSDEVKERLEKSFDGIKLDSDPEKWFSDVKKSKSGTVLSIKAGSKTLTGQEIRAALSLRSAAFDIEYKDGFTITTRGYGHCVGMSQYGANAMAKEGKTYDEILEHYYPGTELTTENG
ncbi:stage II sporulation protein D [Porcipelethomonas sp.]|uniref:stage II sporulation protein D n=1 Tax=Porcipelethomonas sp. TaxID=2981675 RepID=UPI003EF36D3E